MVDLQRGSGLTDDKPDVVMAPPADPNRVSAALTIRVADIQSTYLAKAAGISLNALSRLDRGVVDPSTSTLSAVQTVLEEAGIEFITNGVRLVR